MNALNDFLIAQLGELGPLIAVGSLGLGFMAVAGLMYMQGMNDPFNKLKATDEKAKAKESRTSLRQKRNKADQLDKYSEFLQPKDEGQLSEMRLKLLQAGYSSKSAVQTFHFLQFALGIIGLIFGCIYAFTMLPDETTSKQMLMYIGGPGGAGYMLPKYWVTRRRGTRQKNIIQAFPDSLDLMLICVEAGQSLDQAIIKVSKEIRAGYPDLADEFELVAYEIKAGKDKKRVLKDFSERCGVPDISSFVSVLIQAATYGTPIAEALRVYSAEMRDKRVMRAEEKANTLPVKMTLGTMVFCLPSLLIILVGPAVYKISQVL
jgi:tight adherence protein C